MTLAWTSFLSCMLPLLFMLWVTSKFSQFQHVNAGIAIPFFSALAISLAVFLFKEKAGIIPHGEEQIAKAKAQDKVLWIIQIVCIVAIHDTMLLAYIQTI